MFYDRDSMYEMFEIAMEKQHIEGSRWIPVLITCSVHLFGQQTNLDKVGMNVMAKWTELVNEQIDQHDPAYVVNPGNIFALIHESHFTHFPAKIQEHAYILLVGSARFTSVVRQVGLDEAKFILSI